MVRIIMNGCNGHMGQVISGLVSEDGGAEIVAGVDVADKGIVYLSCIYGYNQM